MARLTRTPGDNRLLIRRLRADLRVDEARLRVQFTIAELQKELGLAAPSQIIVFQRLMAVNQSLLYLLERPVCESRTAPH